MVGHTGNFKATVKAVETVDNCLGKILEQCKENGYTLIITSDHGNADLMYDEKKSIPCTTHSINPVPFVICEKVKLKKKEGILAISVSKPTHKNDFFLWICSISSALFIMI